MNGLLSNFGFIDQSLFLFVYNLPHYYLITIFFGVVSALGSYGFVWLVMAFALLNKRRKYLINFICAFVLLTVTVFVLQKLFGRLRPYNALEAVSYLGFVDPGGYSFPSYHATTSFFSAYIFGGMFKKYRTWFFSLAALISISRVYLGAHYFGDVVAGAVLGVFFARIFSSFLTKRFERN